MARGYKNSKYHSKGEYQIAHFLKDMQIEFEYEFPIAIIDDDGKVKIWYPDFYLKEYQIVIEYFGMYNYNEAYKENAEYKKKIFKQCGIQFVPVYELDRNWQEYILKTILSQLEYKRNKMSEKVAKIQSTHPTLLQRLLGTFTAKETRKKPARNKQDNKQKAHPQKQKKR